MNKLLSLLLAVFLGGTSLLSAQHVFTFEEVLQLAQTQSPDAIRARNSFLMRYWQYRSYKANFLPTLSFKGNLTDFSRQIIEVTSNDPITGEVRRDYSSDFSNRIAGGLSVTQNLPTGGVLSLSSSLGRIDRFRDNLGNNISTEYLTTPLSLNLSQSIFGVNQMKWDKKIEPLYYEEAKRNYIKQMEDISQQAIGYFFSLASAQQAVDIATFNLANNDTLFKIASGRYQMGTIHENELLQSELSHNNSLSSLNSSQLVLENAQNRLRSYLGFNERVSITIVIPKEVPNILLDAEEVLHLAKQNNPEIIEQQRQLIQAAKQVAEQRAQRGFSADLDLSFGLNQLADDLREAYRNPRDMQTLRLGVSIPILDWGRGKGMVKMAQANEELVRAQVSQSVIDFEQEVVLSVRQFNIQHQQFLIAAKADEIAQKRYNVTKQLFLSGKITITDMNNAQIDRDRSRGNYIDALSNYWLYYYRIRQNAQYDFFKKQALTADYEALVN